MLRRIDIRCIYWMRYLRDIQNNQGLDSVGVTNRMLQLRRLPNLCLTMKTHRVIHKDISRKLEHRNNCFITYSWTQKLYGSRFRTFLHLDGKCSTLTRAKSTWLCEPVGQKCRPSLKENILNVVNMFMMFDLCLFLFSVIRKMLLMEAPRRTYLKLYIRSVFNIYLSLNGSEPVACFKL